MKYFLLSVFILSGTMQLHALSMFELFDNMPVNGELGDNAVLAPKAGMDGLAALKISGTGKAVQYAYRYNFEVEQGKKYGASFAYKMSPRFTTMIVMVNFFESNGKINLENTLHFRIKPMSQRWKHQQLEFTAPPGAVKAQLVLRLINVPAEEFVLVDNLRVADLEKGGDFFYAKRLETFFDNWVFLGQQHFEHYILHTGAEIVHEWRGAKVGEAFFKASGDNSGMQYPLLIENITVQPNRNYTFKCWLDASESFNYGLGMFMFVLKDASGKQLAQPRKPIKYTDGQWQECIFNFKTPDNCVSMDIWLNMRNMKPSDFIKIDHLRFHEGATEPELQCIIDPGKRQMTVSCPVTSDIPPEDVLETCFIFSTDDGKTCKEYKDQSGKPLEINLNEFEDGEYVLNARVALKNGKTLTADSYRFAVCKDPYWKNDLGIIKDSDPAPAPWKDLKRTDGAISNWDYSFQFSKNGQLNQITAFSDNVNMLASPVEIKFEGKNIFNRAPVEWSDGKSRIRGLLPISGSGWEGTLKITLDYMGFVRYAVNINALKDIAIDHGSVMFKLNSVEFVHRADASWTAVGAVDLKKKPVWESSHNYNEIMFGNIDRGLAWHAPKVYPAQLDFKQTAVKATLQGDFEIQLINQPLKLKNGEKFLFEFALSPYPWRPAENHWKKLRFRAGKYRNFDICTSMKPMKYCGLPASKDDAATHNMLKNKPELMVLYQIPFYITNTMPEWRYFESAWRGYPARAYTLSSFGKNVKMEKCDVRDVRWQELYLYMTDSYLKNFPWDGFYFDCYNADVLSDKGELLHPTFECRSFQERIYLTMRGARPNAFTITHLGANQACTSVGFSNIVLMGEQYRAQCMGADYILEFLTLDEFRYENAVRTGPDRMFLPQYRQKEKINSRPISANILGLALSHNLMLYPSFIEKNVEQKTRSLQFDFGMTDAEFFPYWKSNPDGIGTGNPEVVASYYKNPKGWFITALNGSGKPQEFKLEFAGTTGAYGAECYEPLNDKTVPFKVGDSTVLPPYQCVIFIIKHQGLQL